MKALLWFATKTQLGGDIIILEASHTKFSGVEPIQTHICHADRPLGEC